MSVGTVSNPPQRRSWTEIFSSEQFQGRWVALDHCELEADSLQPLFGTVVDADFELAELCGRLRQQNRTSCVIRLCNGDLASHHPRVDLR